MVQQIAIDDLLPHPRNSNRMNEEMLEKLRRHIRQCGRYEPLTVRPHPLQRGKFEIVNGHHRLKALKSLGHSAADCNVWDVDDDQTLLYLATLNRLSGEDVPERRAILLEELLESYEIEELALFLPDAPSLLAAITQLDDSAIPTEQDGGPRFEVMDLPQVITFMLEDEQATVLNAAIDAMIGESAEGLSRSEALVTIARLYLDSQRPLSVRA